MARVEGWAEATLDVEHTVAENTELARILRAEAANAAQALTDRHISMAEEAGFEANTILPIVCCSIAASIAATVPVAMQSNGTCCEKHAHISGLVSVFANTFLQFVDHTDMPENLVTQFGSAVSAAINHAADFHAAKLQSQSVAKH